MLVANGERNGNVIGMVIFVAETRVRLDAGDGAVLCIDMNQAELALAQVVKIAGWSLVVFQGGGQLLGIGQAVVEKLLFEVLFQCRQDEDEYHGCQQAVNQQLSQHHPAGKSV